MMKDFDGFTAVLSTIADVDAGEELTISYIAEESGMPPTRKRREVLKRKYNFLCTCKLCGPLAAHDERDARPG